MRTILLTWIISLSYINVQHYSIETLQVLTTRTYHACAENSYILVRPVPERVLLLSHHKVEHADSIKHVGVVVNQLGQHSRG